MFLIFTIIAFFWVAEEVFNYAQIKVFKKKRITLKIKSLNSSYSQPVDLKKDDEDMHYIIEDNPENYIKIVKKRAYIYNPHQQPLNHHKKYELENGKTVSVKKKIPTHLISTTIALLIIAIIISFNLIAKLMVKPFVDVSNHVELTHEFADDIDADKWSGITNYLIVGSDSRGNNDVNFSRTDVMIIVSINSNTKKLNIASLLRDTAVQINDETITVSELDESLPNYEVLKENNIKHTKSKTIKLNEAVTYRSDNQKDAFSSGLNSLVNTIEGTYKIPITAIVNITWSDFVNIIDQLEGIDLDITQEMLYTKMVTPDAASGINAAIGELNELYGTNYNFTESGRQHLNGTQALAYVRMRYIEGSDNSDIGRTERIRNFIIELIQQKKSKIFTLASTKTISAISENIYSSFSKDELYDLINEICTTIPTPTEVGCIPYNYENYTRNDKSFVYSEELPEQSEKILCN